MKYVLAVQDLQFGSTGKGQVAGSIAHVWYPDTVVTAWGPNAGHTFRRDGKKWVHTMLATSAICPSVEQILIGPGSVVNLDNLAAEIKAAIPYLRGKRLVIHPQAAVVNENHRIYEGSELLRIGSTMKGTGAALCDKVMRKQVTVRSNTDEVISKVGRACMEADMGFSISSRIYDQAVDLSEKMIVEGAQGFSLGVHTDFYPSTTSRDISTAQLLADCRLPFPGSEHRFKSVGVCRTYPIRVANRPMPGEPDKFYSSGGHYDDQKELDWTGDLNRPPEMTTVTKLPRRVFSFSYDQVIEACRVMNPDFLALTFCDYLMEGLDPETEAANYGPRAAMSEVVGHMVGNIESVTNKPVYLLSYGPESTDVYERLFEDPVAIKQLDGTFLGTHKQGSTDVA
jgi:adenylosuccinate synthase